MSNSEKELIRHLNFLSSETANKLDIYESQLDELAKSISAVVHLNKSKDLAVTFCSSNYLEAQNRSLQFIQDFPLQFMNEIFDQYTFDVTFPLIFDFLGKNDFELNLSVFQKYRVSEKGDQQFHLSNMKYNNQFDQFFCIDFNVNKLDFGVYNLKKIVDANEKKQRLFPFYQLLTKREREIISLIAKGYTNKQMGEELYLSSHTIRTHRNNIFRKLNINHLRQLLELADLFDL
ncbi:MAG TPA: helix-turn-helix transcriptional regulator [Saprospiraceae bacterium]|nr:helix-turn-helix transcriptional regulator [Saprospiraceae bacterium]